MNLGAVVTLEFLTKGSSQEHKESLPLDFVTTRSTYMEMSPTVLGWKGVWHTLFVKFTIEEKICKLQCCRVGYLLQHGKL